jgi:lysophospholipase L1-like esterase
VLDRTVEAARECGAPLVVAVFPLEVQLSEAALARYREGIGVPLAATATDLAPQRVLGEWAASRGVPFVDLTPAFQQDDPGSLFLRDAYVSLDPVHPSALGHARAAALRAVELRRVS